MSLDSMADILHCMEQEGKEFWEVVLAADMEERQVSRESSLAKMLTTWQAMVDASDSYTGDRRSVSGLVGGRRPENAPVRHPGQGHVRRLRQRGHRRGPQHGGVQRLYAPHRSGPHGRSLRRAAGRAAAPVQV